MVDGEETDKANAKLISATDVATAIGIASMVPVAWCLPQKSWQGLARFAAPLAASLALDRRDNVERIGEMIGDLPQTLHPREIQLDCMRQFIIENLRVLREYRPGGWKPEIELTGVEHLQNGLKMGRGVILWVAHLNAYSLVAKMALHRAGYEVSHLSLWRHGYSDTRFGIRCLNPIRTKVEQRYLRERVVIEPEGASSAMTTLRERLTDNGVVSIAATSDGKRPAIAPFLKGSIRLAIGAPYLAFKEGATLLPVFPLEQPDGRFTVTIEPPLTNESAVSTAEYLNWATHRFASLLQPYVLDHPGQWRGWLNL